MAFLPPPRSSPRAPVVALVLPAGKGAAAHDAGGRVGTSPPVSTPPADAVDAVFAAAAAASADAAAAVTSAAVAVSVAAAVVVVVAVAAAAAVVVVVAAALAAAAAPAAALAAAPGKALWHQALDIHYYLKGSVPPLQAVGPAFDPGPASFPASPRRISGS